MSIKIGIRPIIDGRGKVRATLEEKTLNMALAAKQLIENNVFCKFFRKTRTAAFRRVEPRVFPAIFFQNVEKIL